MATLWVSPQYIDVEGQSVVVHRHGICTQNMPGSAANEQAKFSSKLENLHHPHSSSTCITAEGESSKMLYSGQVRNNDLFCPLLASFYFLLMTTPSKR